MTDTTLPDGFTGPLLRPGEPAYDEARVIFNAMIDKRPTLIAQCESPADVAAAVRYAVERGLEIAVRGGGHGVAGTGLTDGGVVVDLRRMNGAEVDPAARTITIGGGAVWADFDQACQPHGLAATGGRVSTTGVAGLTLGGGSGWFERRFGLASDNLLSVDLVTADGRTVTASETENPELFWALHGGGGNFGVATSLTFRLHPLPVATLALLLWPPTHGLAVTGVYRDVVDAGAPDESAVLSPTSPDRRWRSCPSISRERSAPGWWRCTPGPRPRRVRCSRRCWRSSPRA
jgi:FAD/FMN-containing dehydrogenase